MILFFILTSITRLVVRNKKNQIYYCNVITSYLSKPAVIGLGINVHLNNPNIRFPRNKSYLILSNHLSYLDIFILFSYVPAVFIASVDLVKSDAILGSATELSGGLFVDRQDRNKIREELESISQRLDMGLNIVLFPEGTTSNGDSVLPFKSSFFALAEKKEIDIIPTCIKYKKINGKAISPENRDMVYFYGGMPFFGHFFKFLELSSVDVEIAFLEVIRSGEDTSRKELASEVYASISSTYSS